MNHRPSLQRHLWGWSAGALVIVWLSLALAAWNSGRHEAREITDGKLVSVGRLLLSPDDQVGLDTPSNQASHRRDYAVELIVLRWQDGELVQDSHGLASALSLQSPPPPGFRTVRIREGARQGEWRLYALTDGRGGHAAVLVDMAERDDLGEDLAEQVVLPVLLILPLVMLVLWLAIRRGLRPLSRLSADVAALDTAAGERLAPDHRFGEFASSVEAINRLVDSLQEQARRERAFASEVAHELRTPLASLALGASAARRMPSAEALARLEADALRAGHILQQLLDLARVERDSVVRSPVDLGAVAAGVVEDHVPRAYEQQHELALIGADARVQVHAPSVLVELALRNLVDNAIRHTPAGTQVQVDVWSEPTSIGVAVSDNGQREGAPSVPSSDGLGLGLRLVERMAEQMGARLETGHAQSPMTTRYALVWSEIPLSP